MPKRKWMFGIRNKIMLGVYLILFPVLIAGAGIIFYTNYQATVNETVRQYQGTIDAVDDSIGYLEQDLMDISVYFSVNNDVNRLLNAASPDDIVDPLFWSNLAPMDVMKDMLSIKSHIRTLILYPENGLPPLYISRDASVHDRSIEHIRELPLYEDVVCARGDNVRVRINMGERGLFERNRSDKIVYCRELFDLSKSKQLAFFAISMDVARYERIFHNALLAENEAIVLLNADGREMARSGEVDEALLTHLQSEEMQGIALDGGFVHYEDWYIFRTLRAVTGDRLYYLTPRSNWNAGIRSGLFLPALLAIALLAGVIPLSFLVSRIITQPINKLYLSMNAFKEGDFQQQVQVNGHDEIAELAATFNTMVQDLREMIDRNYVMRLREKESELNALQAQINPHFLYNALDSLYWQAADNEQDKLAEDILSLSALFRLLLSSGESDIKVEQEMHIIAHYLHIQKMRFDKKLDYEIAVDENIQNHYIPKLILQPFVENAIVHGLEGKDTWGHVKVSGRLEDDYLCFEIEDNGTGMSQDSIDEILHSSEDKRYANQRIGRYAIRNVKERMRLRYNADCTLEIQSEVGKGSLVRIRIPAEITRTF